MYALTILLLSILRHNTSGKIPYIWPVYLTNWSFTMLTAHLVLAMGITLLQNVDRGRCCQRSSLRSSIHSFSPDSEREAEISAIPQSPLPRYIQLDWVLFNISSTACLMVTIVYFTALYPQMFPHGGLPFGDASLHISNSILMLLEYVLSAMPLNLLHFIYGLIYGLIYTLFSIIFWAVDHSHVIYPKVLDWNHPWVTLGIVLGLGIVLVPGLQILYFCLYRLRLCVYHVIYPDQSRSVSDQNGLFQS